jgi:uncharacterized damage-inducible protein DinB
MAESEKRIGIQIGGAIGPQRGLKSYRFLLLRATLPPVNLKCGGDWIMTETAEQYKMRLETYVAGKDPIAMQREATRTLAALIEGEPEGKLLQRPAPGKWSVTEILAHLAEDELTSSWRYRQMLEHDAPGLFAFDQDLWARVGDYASWKPEDALAMFRLLREANLRMFAHLTPEQWQRYGRHAERGKLTVRDLCCHMAAHDINHIDQVRGILAR